MGKYRYRYPTHEPEYYGEHDAPEADDGPPWLQPAEMDTGNRWALARDVALSLVAIAGIGIGIAEQAAMRPVSATTAQTAGPVEPLEV